MDKLVNILIIISAILIIGTITYNFISKGFGRNWSYDTVKINWVNDPEKVNIMISKRHNVVVGLMRQDNKEECTIWAYEPRGRFDDQYLETLGHEVLHCFRGDFH